MDIENSSRGLLTAFFRQSRTFVVVFALVLTAGVGYLITTKPVYEAKGSLVVKFGQDARPETGASEQQAAVEPDANARQEIIRSYIKIIFSQDMLRGLISEFGALRLYPDLEKADTDGVPIEEVAIKKLMEGDLEVNYDQSHIIGIAVRNTDPQVATEFTDRVMKAFVRRRTEIYNQPQTDFLRQQIASANEKLEAAQSDLQAFKKEAGISAIDEEMEHLLREKSELNTLAYSAITAAQARLAELETQEARMRSTYREDSPLLTRFQQIVAVARADLEQRKNDLNTSGGSSNSLGVRMANVDKRLSYLESQRGNFNALQQKMDIAEENYTYYVKRGEEARINNLLNRQNITRIGVVDHPTVPVEPIRPRKNIFLAVTLLAAMMAGVGTAFSRELLDDRLSNPEQVHANLGIPVFATFEREY